MHEVARLCRESIYRHEQAFGPNHGLDQLRVMDCDLDKLAEVLLVFGIDIGVPEALDPFDDFVIIAHKAAVLVGHSSARIRWTVYEDGQRRIGSDVLPLPVGLFGWPGDAVEELCHKVLAACGLVPWRHLHEAFPDADADSDGEVWLDVETDGTWTVRDA